MDTITTSKIVSFIWCITDDVFCDLFIRGNYSVILPMCITRRLDAVLEPSKEKAVQTKEMLDRAGIVSQDGALRTAAERFFYNASPHNVLIFQLQIKNFPLC